jgi:hypothetical protein
LGRFQVEVEQHDQRCVIQRVLDDHHGPGGAAS